MNKLLEEFSVLSSDQERWELLIKTNEEFKVILDNDETYLSVEGCEWARFNESIGDMPGISGLFKALGIKGELC